MKLSDRSIEALRAIINGDPDGRVSAPYRTARQIEDFFREFDVAIGSGPRWELTQDALRDLNDTDAISKVVKKVLAPVNFLEHTDPIDQAIAYLNKYLDFDGYNIQVRGKFVSIEKLNDESGVLEDDNLIELKSDNLTAWLGEHSQKCRQKIDTEDYSGAITNARSMVEEFFKWTLNNTEGGYDGKLDGDLTGQAKQVMQRFAMDPKAVDKPLKQMLSGMNSILAGLSALRNAASDSHGTNYRPRRRHALIAVSSSHAIVNYFIDLSIERGVRDAEVRNQELEETDALDEALLNGYKVKRRQW